VSEGKIEVSVKLFGGYREAVGREELTRELPAGATLDTLWASLREEWPALDDLDPVRLGAVNHDFAEGGQTLSAGDEVAFFPPVSGG